MTQEEHDSSAAARADLERRVHVDLPRVRPEEMGTTQEADAPRRA